MLLYQVETFNVVAVDFEILKSISHRGLITSRKHDNFVRLKVVELRFSQLITFQFAVMRSTPQTGRSHLAGSSTSVPEFSSTVVSKRKLFALIELNVSQDWTAMPLAAQKRSHLCV